MEAGDNRCMELKRCLERTKDRDEVELVMEEVVDRNVDEEIMRKDSDKQIQISRERKIITCVTLNIKAKEEKEELLKGLAMSRMSLLEQENSESMRFVKEMQDQMESLVDENRILRGDIYDRKEEKYNSLSVKDKLDELDQ